MSLRESMAKVFILIILEIGALCGVPITSKQIEDVMDTMHRTKIEHVARNEKDEKKARSLRN